MSESTNPVMRELVNTKIQEAFIALERLPKLESALIDEQWAHAECEQLGRITYERLLIEQAAHAETREKLDASLIDRQHLAEALAQERQRSSAYVESVASVQDS